MDGLSKKHTARDLDTDIIKIIASFFVVMIHASGIESVSGIVFNAIARFSVPVFVIISGYYMLSSRADYARLAKKCLKLFALMLVWSGIYYIYGLLCSEYAFEGIGELVRYLLTEPFHLWYIYAIITLYLFTPALSVFAQNAAKKDYIYTLALTFVFGSAVTVLLRSNLLPTLSVIIERMKIPYLMGFVFLYLFGGYMQKFALKQKSTRTVIYLLGIAGSAITVFAAVALAHSQELNGLLSSFFAPNVIFSAIAFFVFSKQLLSRLNIKKPGCRNFLHSVADCTLGIYLLHPMVILLLQRYAAQSYLLSASPVAILLRTIAVFFASTAVIFLLKNIPWLKHIAK